MSGLTAESEALLAVVVDGYLPTSGDFAATEAAAVRRALSVDRVAAALEQFRSGVHHWFGSHADGEPRDPSGCTVCEQYDAALAALTEGDQG